MSRAWHLVAVFFRNKVYLAWIRAQYCTFYSKVFKTCFMIYKLFNRLATLSQQAITTDKNTMLNTTFCFFSKVNMCGVLLSNLTAPEQTDSNINLSHCIGSADTHTLTILFQISILIDVLILSYTHTNLDFVGSVWSSCFFKFRHFYYLHVQMLMQCMFMHWVDIHASDHQLTLTNDYVKIFKFGCANLIFHLIYVTYY